MSQKRLTKRIIGRAVMWMALVLLVLLVFLSIYGALLGPLRAKSFFNSPAMAVYWVAFTALLAAALVLFRRLIRLPGLLLIHIGIVAILTGAMWGSEAGHKIQKQLLGVDKIPAGQMIIFEAETENHVTLENGAQSKRLPFSIRLKDFRIKYYKPEYLHVQTRRGQTSASSVEPSKIPVEIGRTFSIGPDLGTITILRTFENFRILIDEGGKTVIDAPQPGYNPALEVQIKNPDGTVTTRYVFERFEERSRPEDKFLLRYHRTVRDYISDVEVIKDGNIVAEKSIEVNRPLHFGGYHFYQSSYDAQAHRYTVLSVVSDTGLGLVYTGYLMLAVGVFWHFWLRPITKIRPARKQASRREGVTLI